MNRKESRRQLTAKRQAIAHGENAKRSDNLRGRVRLALRGPNGVSLRDIVLTELKQQQRLNEPNAQVVTRVELELTPGHAERFVQFAFAHMKLHPQSLQPEIEAVAKVARCSPPFERRWYRGFGLPNEPVSCCRSR